MWKLLLVTLLMAPHGEVLDRQENEYTLSSEDACSRAESHVSAPHDEGSSSWLEYDIKCFPAGSDPSSVVAEVATPPSNDRQSTSSAPPAVLSPPVAEAPLQATVQEPMQSAVTIPQTFALAPLTAPAPEPVQVSPVPRPVLDAPAAIPPQPPSDPQPVASLGIPSQSPVTLQTKPLGEALSQKPAVVPKQAKRPAAKAAGPTKETAKKQAMRRKQEARTVSRTVPQKAKTRSPEPVWDDQDFDDDAEGSPDVVQTRRPIIESPVAAPPPRGLVNMLGRLLGGRF